MGLIAPAAPMVSTPRAPAALARALPVAGLVVLAAGALGVWLAFPTYPGYDAQYGLLWGSELLGGTTPGVDDYRAPTEHPLLLAVGVLLTPLGADASARVLVGGCIAGLVALIVAIHRLGCRAAGPLGGLVAAALLASRLNFGLLAAIGYLDVPYCALIAWAAALEAERPRRGGAVWALLALAGLLRPEAWLLAAAYAVWMRRGPRTWAAAAVAPVVWCATDLALTGDPLFSIHHTDALAQELGRERPLVELPWLMSVLLVEIVKPPVLLAGLAGAILAWRLRRGTLAVAGALVVLTCASYLLIAGGGLAIVYRYLLVAALGVIVLAAFALAGWTTLPPGSAARRRWAAAATFALAAGTAYTALHVHPASVVAQLRERHAQRADLVATLRDPVVTRARACGPLTVPNHKLIPEVRAILGLAAGEVVARSDRSHGVQTRGVAILVDRRIELRPSVNVWEVPQDGLESVMAPRGFHSLAGTRRFAAWGSCG